MKNKNVIVVFILVSLLIFGLYLIPRIKRYIEIDKCLDKGGKWNYEKNICE